MLKSLEAKEVSEELCLDLSNVCVWAPWFGELLKAGHMEELPRLCQ